MVTSKQINIIPADKILNLEKKTSVLSIDFPVTTQIAHGSLLQGERPIIMSEGRPSSRL